MLKTTRLSTFFFISALLSLSCSPTWGQTSPSYPFDLVDDGIRDSNGFALNPRWRAQDNPAARPDPVDLCGGFPEGAQQGNPQCTQDAVTVDGPNGLRKLICSLPGGANFKGHINWRPATFAGSVDWTEVAFDGDYNWDLKTPDSRIITANRPTLHSEADGSETVDRFRTPWWNAFRKGYAADKRKLLNGKPAVVTGWLNLDNVHGAYTELHPIFVFAVRTGLTFDANTGFYADTWSFFMRNWGNQGFCSSKKHYLRGLSSAPCKPGDTTERCAWLGVDLPLGPTAEVRFDAAASVLRAHGEVRGPFVSRTPKGATVRFILSTANPDEPTTLELRPQVHGEIRLLWRPAPGTPPPSLSVGASPTASTATVAPFEELLHLLEASADSKSRGDFEQTIRSGSSVDDSELLKEPLATVAPFQDFSDGGARPYVESVPTAVDVQSEAARLRALCAGAARVSADSTLRTEAERLGAQTEALKALTAACSDAGYLPPTLPSPGR